MPSDVVSAPVSTSVIAVDVAAANPSPAARSAFENGITGIAKQLGFVSQDEGSLNVALTLAPEAAVDPVLLRLNTAFADFEAHHAPLKIRAVVHYGVVFRTQTAGGITFLGSAVRSAKSNLKRIPETGGIVATRDFADFAAAARGQGRNFELLDTIGGDDGLRPVQFTSQRGAASGALAGSDHVLLDFLKDRLAKDLGPFATPLVDNASHSTMTAKELVAALSHEISNPAARQRFEQDANAFIQTRTSGKPAPKSADNKKTDDTASGDKSTENKGLLNRLLKR